MKESILLLKYKFVILDSNFRPYTLFIKCQRFIRSHMQLILELDFCFPQIRKVKEYSDRI